MSQPKKSATREWIESIVVAFILALIIRTFFVQAFKIPTGSMRQTLLEGDRILVSKFTYGAKVPFTKWRLPGLDKPQTGDVVVFIYPEDPSRDFIKRLVAKGGERLEIVDGIIYVDDKPLEENGFKNRYYYNRGTYGQEYTKINVPSDSYYVLGDNSGSSRDSRYWGFVPEENIVGKAFLIYWPLNRIRVIR